MRKLTLWTTVWIRSARAHRICHCGWRANSSTRRRGTACANAKRDAHRESGVLGMGSLLSARNDPPLRPISLLVRSLLTSPRAFAVI
jgi:hypothetical protein